jgi:phosphate uptake regulator
MKRKLIRQGKGGYTVYLPKKWIDRKKLAVGDEIDIFETDTTLVIGGDVKEQKEISIEVTDENRKDIKAILTHLYRKGFNSIIIKGMDPALKREVKSVIDLLLGFEMTQKSDKGCKLENISEPAEQKYDVLLRRIFLIIRETQDTIRHDLETGSLKSMKEVEGLRDQQDKFILFCRRILTKEKYETDPIVGWELLTFLMHIEHAYHYMYKFMADNKIPKDGKILKMLAAQKDYFDLFYNAYFRKDVKSIHKINKFKEKYHFGSCLDLIAKSGGKKAVVFSYMREIFRLMQIGTSPILSQLLEEKVV